MNQLNLIAEAVYQQHQLDLLKEAAGYRLAAEATRGTAPQSNPRSKFLGWVGKQLRSMGSALEQHYGMQLTGNGFQYPESHRGDCA